MYVPFFADISYKFCMSPFFADITYKLCMALFSQIFPIKICMALFCSTGRFIIIFVYSKMYAYKIMFTNLSS